MKLKEVAKILGCGVLVMAFRLFFYGTMVANFTDFDSTNNEEGTK